MMTRDNDPSTPGGAPYDAPKVLQQTPLSMDAAHHTLSLSLSDSLSGLPLLGWVRVRVSHGPLQPPLCLMLEATLSAAWRTVVMTRDSNAASTPSLLKLLCGQHTPPSLPVCSREDSSRWKAPGQLTLAPSLVRTLMRNLVSTHRVIGCGLGCRPALV